MIESVNPATGRVVERYAPTPPEEVLQRLEAADAAHRRWRRTPLDVRADGLRATAARLREERDELAALMATEMGKPLAQGRAEADKCAWVCDFYADRAADFLAPEVLASDASCSYVAFQPVGVVLAVMPWNFPLWQVFRFAAPALMAGNAALLKHASNVPGCALAIERLLHEGGLPRDLFRTLLVGRHAVEGLLAHPLCRAVTLTGSTDAGRAVAAAAGAAIKKTVLELGGSDPYIVLADADLETAVESCVTSRLINSGQSCIAAKRFIVVEEVLEEFEERFVAAMRSRVVGDPFDAATDVGPQARGDLRDALHDQVQRSVEAGAILRLGGAVPARAGAWYPITVLSGVAPGMAAFDEELFGPVAAIVPARSESEAVRLANASDFGLGAAIFSRDVERAERLAKDEIEAGSCFVNDFVRSDPRLPFGGVKQSGYGRELSLLGIREFVNAKTVWIR